jgi:hypothetical protein
VVFFSSPCPASSPLHSLASLTLLCQPADASSEAVAVTVADVLAKHLSTESLEAAHVLSPQEAGHLRDFVTEPADGQQTFLEDVGGAQIFEAFVKVLLNWPNETDVRYVVTLVDELLRADASRAALFLQVKSARADLCVADALLRVVDRYADNAFLVARATHALSLVISTACKRGVVPEASRFIEWIMRTVQSPSVWHRTHRASPPQHKTRSDIDTCFAVAFTQTINSGKIIPCIVSLDCTRVSLFLIFSARRSPLCANVKNAAQDARARARRSQGAAEE